MKKGASGAAAKKLPNAQNRNIQKSGTTDLASAGAQKHVASPKSKAGSRSSLPHSAVHNETKASPRGPDSLPPLAHSKGEEGGALECQTGNVEDLVALLDSVEEATASHPSSSSTALPAATTPSGSSAPSSSPGFNTGKRGSHGSLPKSSPKSAAKKSRIPFESTEGSAAPGEEAPTKREDEDDVEPAENTAHGASPKSKASGKKDTKIRRTKTDISSKKELPQINLEDEEPTPDQAASALIDSLCLDDALKEVEGATESPAPSTPAKAAARPSSARPKTKKDMERQYADNGKQIKDLGADNEKLARDLDARSRQIQDLTTRLRSTDKDLKQYASYTEEINKAHTDSARMMTEASKRLANQANERAGKAQQQIEKLQKELADVEVHARKIETQPAEQKAALLKAQGRKSPAKSDTAQKADGAEIATQESKVPGRRKSGGGSEETETAEPPPPSAEELEAQLQEFEVREARASGRVQIGSERTLILKEKLHQAELRVKEAEQRIKTLEIANAKRREHARASSCNSQETDPNMPASHDDSKKDGKENSSRSWRSSITDKFSKFRSPSLVAQRRFSRTSRTSKATRFSTQIEFGTAASVDIGNQARMSTSVVQLGDELGTASTATTATGRLPALPASMRTRSIGSRKGDKDKDSTRKSGRWSMLESAKSALSAVSGMKKTEETPVKEISPSVMPEASNDEDDFCTAKSEGVNVSRVDSAGSAWSAWTSKRSRGGSMEHRKSVVEKMKSSLPSMKRLWGKQGSMTSDMPDV